MNSKNIGWHTRLYSDNTKKVAGGSFSGEINLDTVNNLVRYQCPTVIVKNSGTPVFVDRSGREVRLYVSVDVQETDVGKAALAQWYKEKEKKEREEEQRQGTEAAELDLLMGGMSHEEIVKRLKRESD